MAGWQEECHSGWPPSKVKDAPEKLGPSSACGRPSRDILTLESSGSFPPWNAAHVVHPGMAHAGMLHTRASEKASDRGPEVSGSSSGCVTR